MFNIVLMFALFLDKGPEILNFAGIKFVARNVARNMTGLFFKCLMFNIVLKFALLLDNCTEYRNFEILLKDESFLSRM